MDAYHMSTGCSTWPAWWSYNLNWPYNGEIDIIEGIHQSTRNKLSIHTGQGCRIVSNIDRSQQGILDVGPVYVALSCYALQGGDSSCGVLNATVDSSSGQRFSRIKGGVYACMCFFSFI